MAYELKATSDYLRDREVFLIRIEMSEYLLDYYHQRRELAASTARAHDEKLKDLIASFAIHLTARTALETHAWTLHIVDEQPYSLFVTGSTGELGEDGIARGFLVGHILTEHIRHSDTNAIHAQCINRGKTFRSYVPCESSNIASMVESFYRQSEQRPIRIKISETSDSAIGLAALPGFESAWFYGVDLDELAAESEKLDKTRMRNCHFTFTCDCSPEKLTPFFKTLGAQGLADLYGDDEELMISCPRCGRRFAVRRELIESTHD
ncbi:MAG: hypothetical protein RL417_2573 [Pseudomonadota bacterium]|jgi:hypothetical protein